MRPGKRGRLTKRVLLILAIATGVALANYGANAATAATNWAGSSSVSTGGSEAA